MATDIRQSILDELERQGKSRYWLVNEAGLSNANGYGFLRGDSGARQDVIERILDVLDLRLVPGELADTIGKGKGKRKAKRTSKGKRRKPDK